MRIPTVHLNGTSGCELLNNVTFASLAVEHAIDKLRDAWPNARDYYVQDHSPDDAFAVGEAFAESCKEWNARLEKLSEVKKDLDQIAESIGIQLEQRGEMPW